MRWPWSKPHRHNKLGGWAGDVWDFGSDDDDPPTQDRHVARWRCSEDGVVWEQVRDFNEYPHITSQNRRPL